MPYCLPLGVTESAVLSGVEPAHPANGVVGAYILFAPFVGQVADSFAKAG